jgi:hypothetical protein
VEIICDIALIVDDVKIVSKFVKRLETSVTAEQDPTFEEVGKRFCNLVFGEYRNGHIENLIEFFERTLLGLAID